MAPVCRDRCSQRAHRRLPPPRLVAAIALAGLACASSSPRAHPSASAPKDTEPFPSRDEVRKLGEGADLAAPTAGLVRVESWDLAGPFPEEVGERPIGNPDAWEQLLV